MFVLVLILALLFLLAVVSGTAGAKPADLPQDLAVTYVVQPGALTAVNGILTVPPTDTWLAAAETARFSTPSQGASTKQSAEVGLREMLQSHNKEVLKWIEAMNSGGNKTPRDSQETSKPLYQLETHLGPYW